MTTSSPTQRYIYDGPFRSSPAGKNSPSHHAKSQFIEPSLLVCEGRGCRWTTASRRGSTPEGRGRCRRRRSYDSPRLVTSDTSVGTETLIPPAWVWCRMFMACDTGRPPRLTLHPACRLTEPTSSRPGYTSRRTLARLPEITADKVALHSRACSCRCPFVSPAVPGSKGESSQQHSPAAMSDVTDRG